MPTLAQIVVHPVSSTPSGYGYEFTPKHHGADPKAAQWLPALTLDEEFSVFDMADQHNFVASCGTLYGLLTAGGVVRTIGVWGEQLAEFPVASPGSNWHGYPVYPLVDFGPPKKRGQAGRPEKKVLDEMLGKEVIAKPAHKRLMKGDHV